MKKLNYKYLLVFLIMMFLLPVKSFAAGIIDANDVKTNILCKKNEAENYMGEEDTVQKGDTLICDVTFGYGGPEKNINFADLSGEYNIKGLSVDNDYPGSILKTGSNIKIDAGFVSSGPNSKIDPGFKVKVTGNPGTNISIDVYINYGAYKTENPIDKLHNSSKKNLSFKIVSPASSDSTLKSLSLSGINLSPAFNPNTDEYTATTTNASTEITAVANNNKAEITGIGNKNLSIGKNNINVIVKAEDGSSKTYKIIVTRNEKKVDTPAPKSNDSSLSSLSVNGKKINLKSGVYEYSLTVANNVTRANIDYKTNNNKASANMSGNMDLSEGDYNQITIAVTAEDGTTSTYKVNVKRNMNVPKSGVGIPISIVFLGIVGALIYFKVKDKSYIQKI